MDEELPSQIVSKKQVLPNLMASLDDKENVYRFVQIEARDRNNKAIPAEREFAPKPNDEGKLSVDTESLTTPEKSLARLGATYRTGKEEFKNYTKWEIYSLNVASIRLLDNNIDVIEDSIVVNPSVKGQPDNPSHSLINLSAIKEPDLPEIILKLRNHAKDNKVPIDMGEVGILVEQYRAQWEA